MASLHQLPPELHLAAHAAVLPGMTGLQVAECQRGKVDLMARVLQLTAAAPPAPVDEYSTT
jgi:hypothetical protein